MEMTKFAKNVELLLLKRCMNGCSNAQTKRIFGLTATWKPADTFVAPRWCWTVKVLHSIECWSFTFYTLEIMLETVWAQLGETNCFLPCFSTLKMCHRNVGVLHFCKFFLFLYSNNALHLFTQSVFVRVQHAFSCCGLYSGTSSLPAYHRDAAGSLTHSAE